MGGLLWAAPLVEVGAPQILIKKVNKKFGDGNKLCYKIFCDFVLAISANFFLPSYGFTITFLNFE